MQGCTPNHLIEAFGTLGLFAIVFAESGLLVGLLPARRLAAVHRRPAGLPGHLNFPVIVVGCFVAAIAGDQVGYVIGRRVGPAALQPARLPVLPQEERRAGPDYFDKNGPKTIILARFIPVIRTFAPVVAGVGEMDYRKFVTYNVVGGFLWAVGVTTAGYVLGESIPDIDKYLLPIIGVIVIVSFVPVFLELLKMRKAGQAGHDGQAGPDSADEVASTPSRRFPDRRGRGHLARRVRMRTDGTAWASRSMSSRSAVTTRPPPWSAQTATTWASTMSATVGPAP